MLERRDLGAREPADTREVLRGLARQHMDAIMRAGVAPADELQGDLSYSEDRIAERQPREAT